MKPPLATYSCPVCEREIELEADEYTAECVCGALLELDADAEYVNGSWHDCSHLIVRDDGAQDRLMARADAIYDERAQEGRL